MSVYAAKDFLHGALRTTDEGQGWVRPWRISEVQLRMLSSCMAWHPGLYKQMAQCTSGITIEFETAATKVSFELAADVEPSGTTEVLELADKDRARETHDCISADIDGHHVAFDIKTKAQVEPYTYTIRLPEEASSDKGEPLAGLEVLHRYRIHLPLLRGCIIRNLEADRPLLPLAARPVLLVLGDSLAQGFIAEDPALAWPRLFADKLGCDLVNQGIGGQVIQPGTVPQLASAPSRIVIEYGGNYRYEPCSASAVERDARRYMNEVAHTFPQVPCWVFTPTWHLESAWPTHPKSCFSQIPTIMGQAVAPHAEMALLDGLELMEHEVALLADKLEHPGPEGNRQIAERLAEAMGHPARKHRRVQTRSTRHSLSGVEKKAKPQTSSAPAGPEQKVVPSASSSSCQEELGEQMSLFELLD